MYSKCLLGKLILVLNTLPDINWEKSEFCWFGRGGRGVASLAQPSYRPRQQHKFSLPLTQFLSTRLLSQTQIQIQIQVRKGVATEVLFPFSPPLQAPTLPMTSDKKSLWDQNQEYVDQVERMEWKLVDHMVVGVLMLPRWKYFIKVGWSSGGGSAAPSACACPGRTHPHLTSLAAPHTERRARGAAQW